MPGWAYSTIYLHVATAAQGDKEFVKGGSVVAGLNANAAVAQGLTHTFATPVLGGQAGSVCSVSPARGRRHFDPKSGHEFSVVGGLTYNFINHDLQYQNGIDFHVDWAASQFLSKNVQIGIAGYFFQQLTGDSGSGAKFGDFKGLDASLKPHLYWNAALDVRVRQPDGCSAPMSGHR